jgi:hypothetical protein
MRTKVLYRSAMLLLLYAFASDNVSAQTMFNLLNSVPRHEVQQMAVTQVSTAGTGILGAKLTDVTSPITFNPEIWAIVAANKDVTIKYGVPALAWVDRWLFAIKVMEMKAELIDTQTRWYEYAGPEDTRNFMINHLQQEINKLENIMYVVQTDGAWVDFNKYPGRSRVSAEVRYNSPMGRQYPLLQAENGVVSFHNIPYSSIDGNPVIGVVKIYE